MTQVESALQDARIEYVEESTEGETPADPQWSVLSDYLEEFSASPGANRDSITVVGSGDLKEMFRGAEEPTITTNLYKQQGFVGSGGSPNYPPGHLFTYDYDGDLQSFTLEYRRDTSAGGNDGAGFREYVVAFGCKNTEVTDPGDPSAANPILEELSWEVQKVRTYVIHQPSASTTLDVTNNSSSSVDVTIEDEGAATSETITVAANSTQTTVESFGDVDVIHAESEHDGDILVTDGSGTDILDETTPLAGSDTDNVESEQGLPPLGSGSHGSAIGTAPEDYLFQGVDTLNWQGSSLSDRIHALDLSVSVETSREAKTGTRETAIDIGTRTVEISADTAGPFESATRIAEQFHNESGDFLYAFPDNDVTVKNAEITDAPDITRSAGDTNYIPSTTWQGKQESDSAAVTISYTGP